MLDWFLIDIRFRRKNGEKPRPGDYLQLGPDAVAVANQEIQEAFSNFDAFNDLEATAIDDNLESWATTSSDLFDGQETKIELDHRPSAFIGPYKLLQKIGEGGMGTVWMAQQQEPVRRRVALKVVRAEMSTKVSIARFEAERQALALMDHQNIAKILDAGTTDQGNPYFVMELVNGVPLNNYCDEKRLNIRQRLELMIPVCRAIQHAHQKGIIHRDLKHSNVLVTQYDDQPVPKIIDFGLAKSYEDQHKLTDKTMFTEFGKVVGTLQYMSPEQAEMSGLDVDTRSDIYSLGVMIYKLLTGCTPLDNEAISTNSFVQVLELIRNKEPLRPSARLTSHSNADMETLSHRYDTKPEKIIQQVQGDIDWIVLKALEKDRSRRYETATGLALDIERYLNNDVVRATPPSAAYRLRKMYKRNRGLAAAAIACTALLLLGIIGTSIGLYAALQARDRANEKTIEAKIESENAILAEKKAQLATAMAESRLHAIRIKSAWSDWQLGNIESAWQMLNSLSKEQAGWESQFLRTEFTQTQQTLFGHALHVVSVDVSPDGKFIATAADDNLVKIWDGETKDLLRSLPTQGAPAQVRFSPDSRFVACAERSNKINVWDVETGQPNGAELGPYPEDVLSLEFFSDGKRMVVGTGNADTMGVGRNKKHVTDQIPVVRVLNLDDGAVETELHGHQKGVTAVDCSADGQYIVSSSMDATIRIWERAGDEYLTVHTLAAHDPGVLDVAISPDERTLASCGKDSTIRIWEMKSGQLLKTFVGHSEDVTGIAYSKDGKYLVSGSSDRTARVWDLDGEERLAYQGHFAAISDVSFSSDGMEILTASHDKTIRVWNAKQNPSTFVVRGHRDVVWQADMSPDGKKVVSGSEDATVCLIDTTTGELIGEKIKHGDAVLCVAHSPVADIFVSGGAEAKLRVFSSVDGSLMQTIDAHDGFLWDVSFSKDGKRLLSASSDNTVKIWNTDDWSLVKQFKAHDGELGSARFSNDGQLIVTAGDDRLVKLWDATTFQLLHTFAGHRHTVWRAIFSPADDIIASSSYDGQIILWDVERLKQIRSIKAHQNQIAGLAFSADGSRIVSASDDQMIKIWDIDSGIELFVLRDKNDSPIVHASFSRDGKKLVSGNQGGWLTIRSTRDLGSDARPFLPQDAEEIMTSGILEVTSEAAKRRRPGTGTA